MKNLASTIAVLITVIFSSCKSDNEETITGEGVGTYEYAFTAPAAGYDAGPLSNSYSISLNASPFANKDDAVTSQQVDKKKIIKDGNISIKVQDIELAKAKVDTMVRRLNAYYDKEEYSNGVDEISYNLTVRIPSEKFEGILHHVEDSIGELTGKNISSRDVTEEFIDVETRLNNKKTYLKRYNELLTKATSVKDIMAIEESVRTLQEEIESKEGRLQYLKDQVAYSTLYIRLFKEKEYVFKPGKEDKFSERFKNSLNTGWRGIVNSLLWLMKNWPFIIAIGIIFAFWRWRRSR